MTVQEIRNIKVVLQLWPKQKGFAWEKSSECYILFKWCPIELWCTWVLSFFFVIIIIVVMLFSSIAECSRWKKMPFSWLSHGTNISSNWAKVAKGWGIYWWVMYLHRDVFFCPLWEYFLVKRQKNKSLFLSLTSSTVYYRCHVLLYKEIFSYLTGATHRGKICSVMWCAALCSQQPTSTAVFRSSCFILKPFCNTDIGLF